MTQQGTPWTETEDAWLWDNLNMSTHEQCAVHLGRKPSSVRTRALFVAMRKVEAGKIDNTAAAIHARAMPSELARFVQRYREKTQSWTKHAEPKSDTRPVLDKPVSAKTKEDTQTERAGAKWSEEEDGELVQEIQDGILLTHIAESHGRSLGGIVSRLRHIAADMVMNKGASVHDASAAVGLQVAEVEDAVRRRTHKNDESDTVIDRDAQPEPDTNPVVDKPPRPKITLSDEQASVIKTVVEDRHSVFMTGSAGTGKTTTIKALVRAAEAAGLNIGVTGMTGCAAVLLDGQTMHSFLGIGIGDKEADHLANYVRKCRPKFAEKLMALDVLVIDEASMLDAALFDKVSRYLGYLRRRRDAPFGGVTVLLCGDMCQLPPVNGDYCFKAEDWAALAPRVVMLERLFRQSGDDEFAEMLQRLRWGECSAADLVRLQHRQAAVFPAGIEPTRVYALNRDVDAVNRMRFSALQRRGGGAPVAATEYSTTYAKTRATSMSWASARGIEERVQLCRGAQVVVTWNVAPAEGIVNGSRGVVLETRPDEVVLRLVSGLRASVPYVTIAPPDSPNVSVTFMPLKLAWASTVHRLQGTTLDCMEVDLGKSIFEYGQAYTALSRARSLESVRIVDVDPDAFKCHPDVVAFYGAKLDR
jgi:ATP-dependent exoDNAse (exonuclease V) alpha subunit